MSIVMPNSFALMIAGQILKKLSAPVVHESADGKFTLVIQDNHFLLRTKEVTHFNVLKFDGSTRQCLADELMNCYIYDSEDNQPRRSEFKVNKLTRGPLGRPVLDYIFTLQREGSRAWINFDVQGHGTVKFCLPEID